VLEAFPQRATIVAADRLSGRGRPRETENGLAAGRRLRLTLSVARVVQKFGGTSVADAERIRAVAGQVARTRGRGDEVVVVISAMGKETDDLLRLAGEVADIRPGREMDMLVTAGERKATALLCMAIHSLGVEAMSFTGSQAGFITDTAHTNARILELRPERIEEALSAGVVPVVGGSQGVSTDRDVTFLGRGGSDTTAVALAHALGAEVCELYTDVPGVFTSDPRIVPNARKMKSISFDEMLEMTATGCPKPAMRSVEYARTHGVKLHVRSAFTWGIGTWVEEENSDMEQAIISAVTHDTSESKLTVAGVSDRPGVAARLFRALADRSVNVDMIVQNVSSDGVTDISFTTPDEDLAAAVEVCGRVGPEIGADEVLQDDDIARVSLIGAGMKSNPGVAATMFQTLADAGVNIDMISTSAIRISCVIRQTDVEDAVRVLHDAFELGQ
jgi:aspartate kinase